MTETLKIEPGDYVVQVISGPDQDGDMKVDCGAFGIDYVPSRALRPLPLGRRCRCGSARR